MAELKENQLIFEDENGNEILCDILFTYDSEEFKKSYVFFSPVGSADEDGKVEVGCASYIPTENGMGELNHVETEEEWDMLSEVFDAFASEQECGCDCDCCDGDCDCEGDCEGEHDHCGCCHHHE